MRLVCCMAGAGALPSPGSMAMLAGRKEGEDLGVVKKKSGKSSSRRFSGDVGRRDHGVAGRSTGAVPYARRKT